MEINTNTSITNIDAEPEETSLICRETSMQELNETDEEIWYDNNRNNRKLGDVLTIQAILCIVLAIAILMLNLLLPQIYEGVAEKYKVEAVMVDEFNDTVMTVVRKITDFMNSTPNAGV